MAGSDHTGRRPSRLSSIGKRDSRSIADRRRVAEADIRSSIYVRPLGTAYDVVKNVCNGQEYVVANATGGTHSAGQVVPLGSFTGNPGEFSFGRPPAGMGGASAYGIRAASAGYGYGTGIVVPPGTESEVWTESEKWCYDAIQNYGISSGFYTRVVGGVTKWYIGLQQFARSAFPVAVAYEGLGARVGEVEVALNPTGGSILLSVAAPPGSTRAVLYYLGDTGGGGFGARVYRWASFDLSGTLLAQDDYIGPTFWQEQMDWCISGGDLYCIEPREADEIFTGPPFSSGVRVTKRNLATLAVSDFYDFPSVSPYNGSSSFGQWPISINPRDGGGVWVHFYNITVSGSVQTWWRRPLTSTLASGGSDESVAWGTNYFVLAAHCLRRVATKHFALGSKVSGDMNDLWQHSGTAFVSDRQLDIVPTPNPWLERTATDDLVVRDSSYLFRIY